MFVRSEKSLASLKLDTLSVLITQTHAKMNSPQHPLQDKEYQLLVKMNEQVYWTDF